ncbi:MAG: VWA domain-containing protein, partial [Crenarchaeota archaeon]|nr:VWA domain-containing protein [Thermoproteota archaeon]
GTMYQYPLTTALNWLRTYRYFNVSAYVVFASDGQPADKSVAMKVVEEYAELHIPIYTIFIGKSSGGYHLMEKIAEITCGKCFLAANAAQILDKYIKVAEEVKSNIIRSIKVTVNEKIKVQQKYSLEQYLYIGGIIAYLAAILTAYLTRRITY